MAMWKLVAPSAHTHVHMHSLLIVCGVASSALEPDLGPSTKLYRYVIMWHVCQRARNVPNLQLSVLFAFDFSLQLDNESH